jgi:two-component system, NtrC family, sensor histidine kinase HydH
MAARQEGKLGWIDLLWFVFLIALALLPPISEIHKQLTLLAVGVFQLVEGRLVAWRPGRGRAYAVLIKILLATLLLGHTGEAGINSSYWPIFFLPVVTAAIYFGPVASMFWTALAAACYCSYLIPALEEFEITWSTGYSLLALRILFFFLAAVVVNRFVMENRRHVSRLEALSDTLAEANRKLQQAQADARRAERLAALGQLSAGLAHEIRNPLGVIKGSAEMLSRKLETKEPVAGELAGYISSEVNRLNALVARFLDFARPSHLELLPLAAPPIVDRALDAVRNQYPSAGVSVEKHYSEDLPMVLADQQLCEQVFINLILNAYEAMGAQEATPTISNPNKLSVIIAPDSEGGLPGVAVEIEDSGPGIPAAVREQIFNPFFTSKKTGVGLGLSIVAKIVDDHGGSIRVNSDSSRGACFRVFLPAALHTA